MQIFYELIVKTKGQGLYSFTKEKVGLTAEQSQSLTRLLAQYERKPTTHTHERIVSSPLPQSRV